MKRSINILIMMVVFTFVFAQQNDEVTSILKDGGFTSSEQKVILSIFEDAREKGIPFEDLVIILKEQRLKDSSYYEVSTEILKKIKVLSSVKESNFPYWSDGNVRKVAFYLAELYTSRQFMELSKRINEKKLRRKDIENLFKLILFLNSAGINSNDSFSLIYLIVENKEMDPAAFDAIQRIVIRSKELKLNPQQIIVDISKQLSRGISLRKTIENIEKRAKEEN